MGVSERLFKEARCASKNPLDLFSVLSNMWNTLPDSYFTGLIASMPKSIESVWKNRGGPTKYQIC